MAFPGKKTFFPYVVLPLWLAAAMLFCSGSPAFARTSSLACQYLIDEGIKYYENGEYVQAIQEFSKVILLEPDNPEALRYLRKMGLYDGYFGSQYKRISYLVRMWKQLRIYKEKCRSGMLDSRSEECSQIMRMSDADLQKSLVESHKFDKVIPDRSGQISLSNPSLKKSQTTKPWEPHSGGDYYKVDESGSEDMGSAASMQQHDMDDQKETEESRTMKAMDDRTDIPQQTAAQPPSPEPDPSSMSEDSAMPSTQSPAPSDMSSAGKYYEDNGDDEKIPDPLMIAREREARAREMRDTLKSIQSDLQTPDRHWEDNQAEYENRISEIQREYGRIQFQKAKSEEEYKDQLETLRSALEQKVGELQSLQDRLLFAEYKLSNRNKLITKKSSQIIDLKRMVAELDARLTGMKSSLYADDPLSYNVDGMSRPSVYSDFKTHRRWIRRQDRLITKLKNKLLWAHEKLEDLAEYGDSLTDQEIEALKAQLSDVNEKLKERDALLEGKGDDSVVMEQRLKDAQARVDEVEKILQGKDEQIKQLEGQINGAVSQFEKQP